MSTAEATGQSVTIGNTLAIEMEQEAAIARKLLERLPEDKFGWQPHEKSMTLGRLANHVAEIYEWTTPTIKQDVFDFAEIDYKPEDVETTEALLTKFDNVVSSSIEILNGTTDPEFMRTWTMKEGDKIFFEMPKAVVMRSFVMNHMVHHRGQLSVFMRLLDIPVPQIYGPSADEPDM